MGKPKSTETPAGKSAVFCLSNPWPIKSTVCSTSLASLSTLKDITLCYLIPLEFTGVLISPLPDLLTDVFCLMLRIFLLMLVLFYLYK